MDVRLALASCQSVIIHVLMRVEKKITSQTKLCWGPTFPCVDIHVPADVRLALLQAGFLKELIHSINYIV